MFICLMGWRAWINCKPIGERCLCGLLLLFPFGSTGVFFSFFPMINQPYFRSSKNSRDQWGRVSMWWWITDMMTGNPGQWSISSMPNQILHYCHLFDWSMYPSISQYRSVFREYFKKLPKALGDIDDGLLFVVLCCSLESTQEEFFPWLAHQWWYVDILWWRLLSGNL